MILFAIYFVMVGYVYSEAANTNAQGVSAFHLWLYAALWPMTLLDALAGFATYRFHMWGR